MSDIDRLELARFAAHFYADGNVKLAETLTQIVVYPDCEGSLRTISQSTGIPDSTLRRHIENFKTTLGRSFVTAGYVPESLANAQTE